MEGDSFCHVYMECDDDNDDLDAYFFVLFQARFLLFKVNPTMTHNNMYAWGGVSIIVYSYFYIIIHTMLYPIYTI